MLFLALSPYLALVGLYLQQYYGPLLFNVFVWILLHTKFITGSRHLYLAFTRFNLVLLPISVGSFYVYLACKVLINSSVGHGWQTNKQILTKWRGLFSRDQIIASIILVYHRKHAIIRGVFASFRNGSFSMVESPLFSIL